MKFRYLSDELRAYRDMKASIESMHEEIATIDFELTNISATNYDKDIISGSGENGQQERIVNALNRKHQVETDLRITEETVMLIEKGLKGITAAERHILTSMYINHDHKAAQKLMEEMHIESSQLYRLKNKSLLHYGMRKYGQIQL